METANKAVFIDRDGTLTQWDSGWDVLKEAAQIEFFPFSAEAVRLLNENNFLVFIVTNQPQVAKGTITEEELIKVNAAIEQKLAGLNAVITETRYCPHYPKTGFPGEVLKYKVDCGCRKPKPGMILYLAEKYNIDLSQSCMIGDQPRDIEAGIAAGCKRSFQVTDNFTLLDAVNIIIKGLETEREW
jgi:D-glycero-D-manno-heptose 1,7-bisphosphate phosphatase